MSLRQLLTIHLDELQIVVDDLLRSISDFDNEAAVERVCAKAETLVQKDESLHKAVKKLIEHHRLQNEIDQLNDEIEVEDTKIISFTRKLASLEQNLHDATVEEKDRRMANFDGISQKQIFTANEEMTKSKLRLSLDAMLSAEFVFSMPKTEDDADAAASSDRKGEAHKGEGEDTKPGETAAGRKQANEGEGQDDQKKNNQSTKAAAMEEDAIDEEEEKPERATFKDFLLGQVAQGKLGMGDDSSDSDEDEDESDEEEI
eukprot:jgi/Bigna1/126955/aug1.3_g1663